MPQRYAPTDDVALVLIGGGGHAAVVLDAALQAGGRVDGFYDDRPDASIVRAATHLGTIRDITADLPEHQRLILAIGDLRQRLTLLAENVPHELSDRFATVVHPSAIVARSVEIEAGTFVGPGAIVNARARVSVDCIINSGAIVEHDCWVRANAHVAPGAVLGGGATVERHALVGIGSRILPGRSVGMWSVVGAGASVIEDVPERTVVAGVPAQPIGRAGRRTEDVESQYAARSRNVAEAAPPTQGEADT